MSGETMERIEEGLRKADILRKEGLQALYVGAIFDIVKDEFMTATAKHSSFASTHEGHAVLREEFEEMWDEIKVNNPKAARKEAVQVAAMAVRFIFDVEDDWSD